MLSTVSLKLAEKLRDAGFPQHSCYFSWGYDATGEKVYPTKETSFGDAVGRIADAPSAEEILDILRLYNVRMWICHQDGLWIVNLVDWVHEQESYYESQLVEAAAKAWLHGRREGLI